MRPAAAPASSGSAEGLIPRTARGSDESTSSMSRRAESISGGLADAEALDDGNDVTSAGRGGAAGVPPTGVGSGISSTGLPNGSAAGAIKLGAGRGSASESNPNGGAVGTVTGSRAGGPLPAGA